MIYTTHERIDSGVKTTTIHGRMETLALFCQQFTIYNRYAEVYLGECVLIIKERTA